MSYTMLLNVKQIDGPLPYEVIPGHFIDRATDQQVAKLRELVNLYLAPAGMFAQSSYENRVESGQIIRLDRREYRYFVLNYLGLNSAAFALSDACLLLPSNAEIALGFSLLDSNAIFLDDVSNEVKKGSQGISSNWYDLSPFFREQVMHLGQDFLRITLDDLAELRDIYRQLEAHNENIIVLRSLIQNLRVLKVMDPRSRLQFMGYMGIIESLLTHKPDPHDPHESLQKQIKNKMALLANRIKNGFDYPSLAPNLTPDKIWVELYGIRSAIAHGGDPEASSKKITYSAGLSFLRETAKKLIRYTLEEPKLIVDLRKC